MADTKNNANTNTKFREIEEVVLKRVRPSEDEREKIMDLAKRLVDTVNESKIAHGMVVGSIARDTWLSGDKDLDVFMLFSPDISREELEEKGLGLAKEITAKFCGTYVEKYAEHPYLNATIEGFDIDLVPCYNVSDASAIQSAVDRTPFHTRYMRERIAGLTDDVRLLKLFLKSCGTYGSDLMTGGFAGYLCEILVCYYGGFEQCLKAASSWHFGLVIDIEKHQAKEFSDPLTVIDPVDPRRNVAASLTASKMYEFSEYAGGYIENPSPKYFEVKEREVYTADELKQVIKDRGTKIYAITFKTPNGIPDIVVPQLRKSARSLTALLERHGFCVNRCDSYMGENECIILSELLYDTLPAIEKRQGPPVWEKENAKKFLDKHTGNTFSGPYIEDGFYYAETNRKYPTVSSLLNSCEFVQCGHGKDVKRSVQKGYTVAGDELCLSDEFAPFIHDFFTNISPYTRIVLNKSQ